jgi:hypothetical protein
MARISTVSRHGRYRIWIRGSLSVRDLRRLESACGPALEHERLPLEIRLARMTTVDDAARVFLRGLAARGAAVISEA